MQRQSFIGFATGYWHRFKLYFDMRVVETGCLATARHMLYLQQAIIANHAQCKIVMIVAPVTQESFLAMTTSVLQIGVLIFALEAASAPGP